jgi:hypothetical protein
MITYHMTDLHDVLLNLQELCTSTDPKYHESMRTTLAARYTTFKTDWDAAMYGGGVSAQGGV